jgi:hypothetical protein
VTYVVDDINSTTSIMLNDFIRSMISSSTDNPRLRTSLVVFDTDGIFAHIFEPDVFECAVAIAMNTFGLVFANDGVFERGTCFEEEYCVGFACVLCVVLDVGGCGGAGMER